MAISDKTIEAIRESVTARPIAVSADEYLTRTVVLPPPEPLPSCLEVGTLTGLVDFVKAHDKREGDNVSMAMIHVESPRSVVVMSDIAGRAKRRDEYCRAKLPTKKFPFGEYMDSETFIIALQTMFEQTTTVEQILQIVGTIKEQNVTTHIDDGITQTVVASAGIVNVRPVDVPNPVLLQPYRTFGEIGQPESLFVLRMKQTNALPHCALFEADGDMWKLEAIRAIAVYLHEQLGEIDIPIIA